MNVRLWLAVVTVATAAVASAHEDPSGCFETGAVVTINVFRADGTTGVVGAVSECETINYRVVLQKAANSDTICAFSGGFLLLTTPDGVDHEIESPVLCVGGTSGEGCDPTRTQRTSALIPYTVRPDEDLVNGLLIARSEYIGGATHDSPGNSVGVEASVIKSTPVVRCDDGNACTADLCDPSVAGPAACIHIDDPFVGCQSCGDGTLQAPEQCDAGVANGRADSCCSEKCRFVSSGTTCRSSFGDCDVGEVCTGASGSCPADALVPAGTICHDVFEDYDCDAPEVCDGVSPECPADAPAPNTQICRPTRNECDLPERCNGFDFFCPEADFVREAGVLCGRSDRCDGLGECTDTCGDGALDEGEECDDGNGVVGDGCRDDCRSEVCGDGTKDPQEQCDDGNASPADGCVDCRIECTTGAECRGHGDCTRPLCDAGRCATQPGCTGDPCGRKIRSLVEDSVGFDDVACAFARPLGGDACSESTSRVVNEKGRKLLAKMCTLERACLDGKPGRRLANALRGLSGKIEKLQLRLGPKVSKVCADELNLTGGGLYDRTTLLRALAAHVATDAAGACAVTSPSCN
jgi:cysteine-rich repeat protein